MKKFLIIITALILILLISNINSNLKIGKSYTYSTLNQEFTFWVVPAKGRDIVYMEERFKKFKELNPEFNDLILYRTFKMEIWKFWNWIQYTSPIWDYPYLEVNVSNKNI